MSTGSFIEMFMTTFGWNLYNIVWGVIASTGLAFLPIFAAIIDNIIKPIESQEAKAAAVTSLRRLEIDIIRIIIMMMLAVSPMLTMAFGSVSYTNSCSSKKVTAGSSGTAYDEVFSPVLINNEAPQVPPLFYIVMSVTGGINDAVISRLPCDMVLREIQYEVSSVKIKDPHLRRDTQRFVTECYKPARADYFNNRRDLPSEYDIEDLGWIGSKYFNSTFYKSTFAIHPTPGFAFEPDRRESDKSYKADGSISPENGYPSCHEWWNDSTVGLKKQLLSQYGPNLLQRASSWFSDPEEDAIRMLMSNEAESVAHGLDVSRNSSGSMFDTDLISNGYELVGTLLGSGGGLIGEAAVQGILHITILATPYIQATVLMGIYFLLPWVLLIGNYEWSTIKTAMITIFAIKFWTSIWAVVNILDNQLIILLSRQGNLWDVASGVVGPMRIIVDFVILALYLGLPYFFMSMLGWAGERGASTAGSTSNEMGGGAKQAGNKGADTASSVVTK
ncbi:MAG: conjugal transfer protein TraG N-terminal domain-containing protein [Methylophaga sp.]|jgi:hypothetical protein|uniref:conjugal transfer protein TraG N-terminal domain-containing protein n=1 Tax=Methylophaga sp. TaxID=2024840 RepID=UPI00299D3A64|nr:conjugal transfer protein TraG N-terminal domain-containing protein [Methylophaga sp.]MDX1750883.1 conjugal transfer protein TraG N-terminal domain-containing protein [Methylophaga sp.]